MKYKIKPSQLPDLVGAWIDVTVGTPVVGQIKSVTSVYNSGFSIMFEEVTGTWHIDKNYWVPNDEAFKAEAWTLYLTDRVVEEKIDVKEKLHAYLEEAIDRKYRAARENPLAENNKKLFADIFIKIMEELVNEN